MPLNYELSTLRPTTRPGVTAVLAKDLANLDLMMATLEVVVSLDLTMDTQEEENPVLMTDLAKAVVNLAATPKDTKVLALMMDQRAAAKVRVSPALMVDTREEENLDPMMVTLEVVASPVLTMATLEVAMEEIAVPMTTTVVTEEEMEVEMVEIMTMTPPCNPQTIFSQIWTSRMK